MIKVAAPAQAQSVTSVIATAFQPLAVAQWLVPDPQLRQVVLHDDFRIFVDHALQHGFIHMTEDELGVAVWFPRDREPIPEPERYQERLAAATGDAADRFRHLDELFEKHHPSEPHHHLAFLAVHPNGQRKGRGSTLLAHHHAQLDATGTAAYLEATSEDAVRLYERHGYEVMQEPFTLPNGTPMWPMWRKPRR
ncbi:MAG TPA: GNAT family N-acetyltransferase [Natronosporangium sp.]